MLKAVLFAALAVALAGTATAATDKVVCYLGTWATYRPGNGQFGVDNIDGSLCTHVIYSFVGISVDGSIRLLDSNLDLGANGFKKFVDLKKKNPALKTMVAIGGWNEGSDKFSTVAASASLRKAFIANAIAFVKTHGFDGFDLDWEYPGDRGGRPDDKANFGTLVQEFRAAFDQQKPPLLLTAAVKATKFGIDTSYDVPKIAKGLDFINIMAYDLHGSWDGRTGHNAPLYAHPSDQDKGLNVDACITSWINAGAPSEKLVLGMGTYGQSYTLAGSNSGINAPTVGPGTPGPYTQQGGMLGYSEVCEMQKQGGWVEKFDDSQQIPYAVKGNLWVGYDNPKSITIKTEYAKKRNLGGAMIWSIETDDFRGVCGQSYPLLHAINDALKRPVQSTTSTSTTAGPITTKPTNKPPPGKVCTAPGYVKHPTDPTKFIFCMASGNGFIETEYSCGPGLVFDESISGCNWP